MKEHAFHLPDECLNAGLPLKSTDPSPVQSSPPSMAPFSSSFDMPNTVAQQQIKDGIE